MEIWEVCQWKNFWIWCYPKNDKRRKVVVNIYRFDNEWIRKGNKQERYVVYSLFFILISGTRFFLFKCEVPKNQNISYNDLCQGLVMPRAERSESVSAMF